MNDEQKLRNLDRRLLRSESRCDVNRAADKIMHFAGSNSVNRELMSLSDQLRGELVIQLNLVYSIGG